MKITRKTWTNALLLILAVGVFVLIGIKTDWEKTWQSVRSANVLWLGLSFAIMLTSHWLRAFRWNMLTEPAGYALNIRRSFYAVMSGYLVNVGTSRGGEVVRCALAAKSEKTPIELLIGTVVTERIIDLILLLIFCGATLLLEFNYIFGFFNSYVFKPMAKFATGSNSIITAILLILAIILFFVLKKKRKNTTEKASGLKGALSRFSSGIQSIFQLRSPISFILLSLGIWCGYWLGGYCTLKSLGVTEHLSVLNALSVLIFSAIGIAIPLPAGAGVWGVVSFGLSTVYGLSTEDADTFGIYNLAISNLSMLIFGSISYFLLWLEMQKLEKNDS